MGTTELAGAPGWLFMLPVGAVIIAVLVAAMWLMLMTVGRDVRSWWREYRRVRDMHRAEMREARRWVALRDGLPVGRGRRRTSLRWWDRQR